MKKIFLLLLITCLCAGCVPAIFVAGAAGGGAVIYDKRDFSTMMQDKGITQRAQALINSDPDLRGDSHISIASFNHIVLMVGQANTEALSKKAEQIVSSVKGIKRIYNEVEIQGNTTTMTHADDAWITTKVKAAMLRTSGLHSSQVKAVTEDSIVYLLGLVTRKQGDMAANVASRVAGVQKVVKVFEYQN